MILNEIKLRIEYCGNESSDITSSPAETRFSPPLPVALLDTARRMNKIGHKTGTNYQGGI